MLAYAMIPPSFSCTSIGLFNLIVSALSEGNLMSRSCSVLIENLESRTFLSASTLAGDQQTLATAIGKLGSDQVAAVTGLGQDRASIRTLKGTPDPAMETLLNKLLSDVAVKAQTLAGDRATTKSETATDQAAISHDQTLVRLDKKNPAQLIIDSAQLAGDRSKLAEDKFQGKFNLTSDALDAANLITDDRSAIATERRTGASNPDLKTAEDGLGNDTILFAAQIVADQTAIATDRAIVAQDNREPATQSTDLIGNFAGTVTVSSGININLGDFPATFDVTSQTDTTLVGTLSVPGLNIDASGTFTGSIDSLGHFTFAQTTGSNTVTITGEESFDGKTLDGNGITFQLAGFNQFAAYELDRTN
jgi:hypothetical protein